MTVVSVRKTVLENGVRIVTGRMPGVRSVSMGVWVAAGARDEDLAEQGLSHFIEHMIFKGTSRRSALDIARAFDAVGGMTNAFTSMEHTCYHARVMDEHLEIMIDVLSDIFLNPAFDPMEIERERAVILQEIGMVEDSPDDLVHQLNSRHFWGDHPLGRSILGSPEQVTAVNTTALRRFFEKLYQPDKILISLAGSVDHDRMVDLLSDRFTGFKPAPPLAVRNTPQIQNGTAQHPKTLEQAHICLASPGVSGTDPARFALALLNTVLGGNMSSRLFQTIREEHGLAYAVYSFSGSYQDCGQFGAYAAVSPENVQRCTELLITELRRLKNEPVDQAALRHAQEFTRGSLLLASESVDNQMVRLAQSEFQFGKYVPLETVMAALARVTPTEIQNLAQTCFRPEQAFLTVIGGMAQKDDLQVVLDDL